MGDDLPSHGQALAIRLRRLPTHPPRLRLRTHRVATWTAAGVSVATEPEQAPQQLASPPDVDNLMRGVASGDQGAFAALYDAIAPRVYGLIRRVLRDPALAEEVAQEALVEVWRTAARFDSSRGSAAGWIFTIAHRRAIDRVRAEQAAADRERRTASGSVPFDDVIEEVTARLEQQAVRRCLRALTRLQREAILLAYYGGLTYREVADRLGTALPTVKTRMRDGLIRLRDCLGVSWG
jgi:RNA polymerase sigma-70 factor, ECF subfamily